MRSPLALLLCGLAVFVVLAATSAYALRRVHASMLERERLHVLRLVNERLMSSMIDIETGMRGYVLTYDDRFLAPYAAGLQRYPGELRALEAESAGIAAVRPDVSALRPLIERRLQLAALDVELHRQGRIDGPTTTRLSLQGQAAMDAVRRQSARVDRAVVAEAERRAAALATTTRLAIAAEAAFALAGSAAILCALMLLQREQARRWRAEQDLQRANAGLESRVAERTVELEHARAQLQRFAQKSDREIDRERRRLARDLHDELGQTFTALKLACSRLAERYGVDAGDRDEVDGLIDDGLAVARRVAGELRPPLLDELGLGAAVEHRLEHFCRDTGLHCSTRFEDPDLLEACQSAPLFRIIQEALTNVARHAGAQRVVVEGRPSEDGYEVVVEDDGRGLGPIRPGAAGLMIMRERAALAGGRLDLERARLGGVRVRAWVPLDGAAP